MSSWSQVSFLGGLQQKTDVCLIGTAILVGERRDGCGHKSGLPPFLSLPREGSIKETSGESLGRKGMQKRRPTGEQESLSVVVGESGAVRDGSCGDGHTSDCPQSGACGDGDWILSSKNE